MEFKVYMQRESKRVSARGWKMEKKVKTPLTPPNLTLSNVSPWMGGWAPSTTHNEAHWLLPTMKPSGRPQLFNDPLHPHEASWNNFLPTKSEDDTLQGKNPQC